MDFHGKKPNAVLTVKQDRTTSQTKIWWALFMYLCRQSANSVFKQDRTTSQARKNAETKKQSAQKRYESQEGQSTSEVNSSLQSMLHGIPTAKSLMQSSLSSKTRRPAEQRSDDDYSCISVVTAHIQCSSKTGRPAKRERMLRPPKSCTQAIWGPRREEHQQGNKTVLIYT